MCLFDQQTVCTAHKLVHIVGLPSYYVILKNEDMH